MGIRSFISGEQGNKSLKLKETGEQRQFWGTGNIENQDFYFSEQEKMPIFQENKGTGTYPPPPPPPPVGRASIFLSFVIKKLQSTLVISTSLISKKR